MKPKQKMINPNNAPVSPYTGVVGWESISEQGVLLSLASCLNNRHDPITIVEIGSEFGMSASLFALGATTADIVCIEINDKAPFMKNLESVDLAEWVHPIYADSRTIDWHETAKQLQVDNRIDLLFVDGDHSEMGAFADLQKFSKYVRGGGIIAIHDCADYLLEGAHYSHIAVHTAVQKWLADCGHEQGYRHMFNVDSMMIFRRM